MKDRKAKGQVVTKPKKTRAKRKAWKVERSKKKEEKKNKQT